MRSQTFQSARRSMLLLVALSAASCSRALFVPPAGPGEPALEAPTAWADATGACRNVRTYSALVTLSGNIAGTRFPGLTVNTALTAEGAAHLQAHYSGKQIFLLAGRADRASLWLREEHRVVAAPLEDIVEHMVELRLGGDDLLAILSGCAVRQFDIVNARRYGSLVAVETAAGRVFLEQTEIGWVTRAAALDGLTVDYRRRASRLPTEIVLSSGEQQKKVTLRFRAEQIALDDALSPQLFTLPPGAASAAPMTLEELRESGPLRARSR